MPWMEQDRMSLRSEFCAFARQEGAIISVLAERFGISRKTAYKWLQRDAAGEELGDRSRRPHRSPQQTSPERASAVLEMRDAHPTWGSRKLSARLEVEQAIIVPPTTIDRILRGMSASISRRRRAIGHVSGLRPTPRTRCCN
jgi:transposase